MNKTWLRSRKALALAAAVFCSIGTVGMVTSWADEQSQAGGTAAAESAEAPVEFVPLVSASITSCTITADKKNIRITANGSGDTTGTDGKMYLFELQPYEDGIGGRTDYITSEQTAMGASFTVSLNHGTTSDRLYSKFVMAVYDVEGQKYMEVSQPHYVTNPEVIAPNQTAFKEALTKKGLNIELDMLADAFELGVKHASTNIAFSQIMGSGIEYTYDGKVYHFNKEVVDAYDKTISSMSNKGMTVTAIILNDWNPATPDLVYPGTQKWSKAFYYMFNAANQKGFEETRAIAAFLAEHYNGSNPNAGKVSNWIIGNEINNQQWNYMGPKDLTSYVKAYQQAFRVFYTAIKSTSANDRVYFSLDYYWNTAGDGQLRYTGREIMDSFNSIANEQGQMEWGLAYHPYPHPMTDPEFWDDAAQGVITGDFNSPIINFANINVLTDYLNRDVYKTADGSVRHVILTEEGFTSYTAARGNVADIQAAAYAYSYYLVDSNPYIDAYILSRQVDAPEEGDLRFGLWECDRSQTTKHIATNRKKIWSVFKNIDKKDQTLANTEFAKSIIGINKWSDVVPNFKWKSLEQ